MPDKEAREEEEPASEKPKLEKKEEKDEVAAAEPDKPVPKSVEWGIAIAMMVVLVGFLLLMIHFMRSARSAVM